MTPDDPAYTDAVRRARELAEVFNNTAVVAEAELAARGIHPVSVAHGQAEFDADARLIFDVLPELAERCGPAPTRLGGNDYSTFLFMNEAAALAFIAAASEIAPSWWRITPTAHAQWR